MEHLSNVLPDGMEVDEFMKVLMVTAGLVTLGACVIYLARNRD
tara:strand:- start:267 stop:395 length:129 start_codon:yes stop_codon:yes gene_type:complete